MAAKAPPLKSLTLKLPEPVIKRFHAFVFARGLKMNWIALKWLTEKLDAEEKK